MIFINTFSQINFIITNSSFHMLVAISQKIKCFMTNFHTQILTVRTFQSTGSLKNRLPDKTFRQKLCDVQICVFSGTTIVLILLQRLANNLDSFVEERVSCSALMLKEAKTQPKYRCIRCK